MYTHLETIIKERIRNLSAWSSIIKNGILKIAITNRIKDNAPNIDNGNHTCFGSVNSPPELSRAPERADMEKPSINNTR